MDTLHTSLHHGEGCNWQEVDDPSTKDNPSAQDGPSAKGDLSTEANFSNINDSASISTGDILSSQPSLSTITKSGDTCPNTPNPEYHVFYICNIHGTQNHYGPYCNWLLSFININMLPQLVYGSLPPVLPSGHIPWPPTATMSAVMDSSSTPDNAASPPLYAEEASAAPTAFTPGGSYNAVAGPSSVPPPPAPQVSQGGPFYAVFVGIRTGVFGDWSVIVISTFCDLIQIFFPFPAGLSLLLLL